MDYNDISRSTKELTLEHASRFYKNSNNQKLIKIFYCLKIIPHVIPKNYSFIANHS